MPVTHLSGFSETQLRGTCWWGVGVPTSRLLSLTRQGQAQVFCWSPHEAILAPGPGEPSLATVDAPRPTHLRPVVVDQLGHLLHHKLAHLTVNVSLRGGWVLLLKGQEKNTATESLASPPVLLL